MSALFWISGIALSIFIAFKFGSFFASGSRKEKNEIAKRSGMAVAGFWLLWTFGFSTLFVGYSINGPLAIFQTLIIILVFIFSYRNFFKEEKYKETIIEKDFQINDLKKDLHRIDNTRLNKMLDKIALKFVTKINTGIGHRDILINSINRAKESVVILSGWSTSYSVDKDFRYFLKGALKRGVNVYIGYGYRKSNEVKVKGEMELKAEKTLIELQNWSSDVKSKGMLYVREYPNHAKFLSCDYEYAICGSFNWLSNREFTKNEERSYKISFMGFVKNEVDDIISNFEQQDSPVKRRGFIKKFVPFSDYP